MGLVFELNEFTSAYEDLGGSLGGGLEPGGGESPAGGKGGGLVVGGSVLPLPDEVFPNGGAPLPAGCPDVPAEDFPPVFG